MTSISRTLDPDDPVRFGKSADLLLWVLLALLAAGIAWAALAQVERTTRATGRVRTDLNTQIVSNLEGGLISAVYVRPGETVREGQPLLKLDPVQHQSALDSDRATVSSLRARVERLTAEVNGGAPAFAQDAGDSSIEQGLFAARRRELASLLDAYEARVVQAQRAVAEAGAALEARRTSARTAQAELQMIRPLVERGIEPRIELVRATRQAEVGANEVATAAATAARMQASLAEARADLGRAREEWRARAAGELAASRAELQARERAMPALAGKVDRTIVRAPRDGRVNRILKATVGGSVGAGEPLIEIVPEGDALVVEAMVRPQDIAAIRIGQKANVKITAYDSAVYGGLPGTIAMIAPDAIVNERTGESVYLVRVHTSKAALTGPDGRRLPIGAGMVAEVNLLGEKRSILSYLLTPITRIADTAMRE